MESTNQQPETTPSYQFAYVATYLPDVNLLTAREAILRLDSDNVLELIAVTKDRLQTELLFRARLNEVTKVNTVFSTTYIHLGDRMFRMNEIQNLTMNDLDERVATSIFDTVFQQTPTTEYVLTSKKFTKKMKSLGIKAKYTGMLPVAIATVVGILAFAILAVIFDWET